MAIGGKGWATRRIGAMGIAVLTLLSGALGAQEPASPALPPHDTYGFGVAPLGFLSRWRVTPAVGLRLRASGGVVSFQSPVPDPLACKFNFLADGGVLADVRVTQRVALVAGARLNHISNGGRGRVNPGMDSHMLEAGLSVTR